MRVQGLNNSLEHERQVVSLYHVVDLCVLKKIQNELVEITELSRSESTVRGSGCGLLQTDLLEFVCAKVPDEVELKRLEEEVGSCLFELIELFARRLCGVGATGGLEFDTIGTADDASERGG